MLDHAYLTVLEILERLPFLLKGGLMNKMTTSAIPTNSNTRNTLSRIFPNS